MRYLVEETQRVLSQNQKPAGKGASGMEVTLSGVNLYRTRKGCVICGNQRVANNDVRWLLASTLCYCKDCIDA